MEFKQERQSRNPFESNKLQVSKPNARGSLMRNGVVEAKSQLVDGCLVVVAEVTDEVG